MEQFALNPGNLKNLFFKPALYKGMSFTHRKIGINGN